MPVCQTFLGCFIAPGTVQYLFPRLLTLLIATSYHLQKSYASNGALADVGAGQCRGLQLANPNQKSETINSNPIFALLEKFEAAFANNDSEVFADLVSASLQKKKDEMKQIFDGTVLEFDLQKTRLQRNSIWEINVGDSPSPGRTIRCGDTELQPVYGPTRQTVVSYSAFTSAQQTRLLVIFAKTALDLQKTAGQGLVLLQVQRWTYDGRSPEKLLAEGLQRSAAGDFILGHLLSDAAAKVLESNPYLISPLHKQAREQTNRLAIEATPRQALKLKLLHSEPSWSPEMFVPIFKDGSLALGIKVRMKNDISLNEQTEKCTAMSRKLVDRDSSWRKSFSGIECMPYQAAEKLSSAPKGGSQYFTWAKLDSK